jgi:hypothetical protein
VKAKVILIITGATVSLSRSFQTHLEDIAGKHTSVELQKTAILGTAHILKKTLMYHGAECICLQHLLRLARNQRHKALILLAFSGVVSCYSCFLK